MIALVATALAVPQIPTAAPCEVADAQVVPPRDTVDAPISLSPALVVPASCTSEAPFTVRVTDLISFAVVATVTIPAEDVRVAGVRALLEVPLPELAPDTEHEVLVASSFGEPHTFRLSTGPGPAPSLAGTPAITVDDATVQSGTLTATVILTPSGDGQAVYVVREAGVDRAIVVGTGGAGFTDALSWPVGSAPAELCLDVEERAVDGTWNVSAGPACVPVESMDIPEDSEGCGCANGPTPWGGLGLFVGLLLLRGRR